MDEFKKTAISLAEGKENLKEGWVCKWINVQYKTNDLIDKFIALSKARVEK